MKLKLIFVLYMYTCMHVNVVITPKTNYTDDACKEIIQTVKYGVSYPKSEREYQKRAKEKGCWKIVQNCTTPDNFRLTYAVTNSGDTVELCAPTKLIKGYCLQFIPSVPLIQEYLKPIADCRKFKKSPCYFHYKSYESYKFFLCFEYLGNSDICPGSFVDILNMEKEITDLQEILDQVNKNHSYQLQQNQILMDKNSNLTRSNEILHKKLQNITDKNETPVKNGITNDIPYVIIVVLAVFLIVTYTLIILVYVKRDYFWKLCKLRTGGTSLTPEEQSTDSFEIPCGKSQKQGNIDSESDVKEKETSLFLRREANQYHPMDEPGNAELPHSNTIEVQNHIKVVKKGSDGIIYDRDWQSVVDVNDQNEN